MKIISRRTTSSETVPSGMSQGGDGTGNGEKRRQAGKNMAVWVIVGLLLVSLIVYRDSMWEILTGLRQVTPQEIGVSALLALLAYILEGMTIFYMMGAVTPVASASEGIYIAFLCEFYRLTTFGNGAGIAQIHYMHKNGIEPGNATVLTMIQYVWKRVGIMILGGVALCVLYFSENTRGLLRGYSVFVVAGYLGTLAVIAVFLSMVYLKRMAEAAEQGLDFLTVKLAKHKERFANWKEQVGLLNQSGRNVLQQRNRMSKVLLFQLGKLLLFYSIPAWLLRKEIAIGTIQSVALMAVVYLLSGVIPSPSGAGSLEFLFLLFFTKFTGMEAALPAILVFRFTTWILPFLLGGMMLLAKRVRCPFR